MIRVLAVDHTAGVALYRKKFSALARHPGIELTVLAPDRWIEASRPVTLDIDREDRSDGYRLRTGAVVWPGYENRGFFVSGLASAFRAARPHILHLWEEPYSFIALQALTAKRLWAPRASALFYSAYDLERSFRYPWRPASLYKWIELRTFHHCKQATAVTEQAARILRGKGYGGPIEVIPLAIDPEDYPLSLEPRFRAGDSAGGAFRIGYAGRLIQVKGVDTLIRAFADLPATPGSEAKLRIVGGGPEREALRRLARDRGLAERVSFEDPVPHEAMPRFYHDIDVLVLSSRTLPHIQEQFGRVLIEAMACGCVVIGSSSGGIPSVIGDAGLIVPEDDPGALAAAIARVRDEPRLASELRARGRQRVLDRFTWDANARRLTAIYEEMARERTRSS